MVIQRVALTHTAGLGCRIVCGERRGLRVVRSGSQCLWRRQNEAMSVMDVCHGCLSSPWRKSVTPASFLNATNPLGCIGAGSSLDLRDHTCEILNINIGADQYANTGDKSMTMEPCWPKLALQVYCRIMPAGSAVKMLACHSSSLTLRVAQNTVDRQAAR